jgi:23S rRNA pseudouridine2605 synthase
VIARSARQSILRMTITEGKSRQVRRMVEAVGHSVVHLIRTGFGKITLGDLKVGEYRHLETEEVEAMKKLVGMV